MCYNPTQDERIILPKHRILGNAGHPLCRKKLAQGKGVAKPGVRGTGEGRRL